MTPPPYIDSSLSCQTEWLNSRNDRRRTVCCRRVFVPCNSPGSSLLPAVLLLPRIGASVTQHRSPAQSLPHSSTQPSGRILRLELRNGPRLEFLPPKDECIISLQTGVVTAGQEISRHALTTATPRHMADGQTGGWTSIWWHVLVYQ